MRGLNQKKMMYYVLNEDIALRSWWLVPYAYYAKGYEIALGISKKEFELLLQCDGNTPLNESETLQLLLEKRLIMPCAKGEKALTAWQKYLSCENRYFPKMNWMITGKCNYNCLHCFNAADNAPLMAEWTWEEAQKLIEEAQLCGVNAFTLTGGEPMLHKHFFDIVKSIYDHGMFVEEINTNGFFINEKILQDLKDIGADPLFKISFDGVGHHDWLRNKKGAEEIALNAIKLCKQFGFRVKAQTNVNRRNVEAMLPTIKLLDALDVEEIRIIRTTEAPRWIQNAGDATLSMQEYYDAMLALSKEVMMLDLSITIDFWIFMTLYPDRKMFKMRPCDGNAQKYRDSLPVCPGARGMVAVAADGEVYPCHQMSGRFIQEGISLANIKKTPLQTVLQSGAYLDKVCLTVGDRLKQNPDCQQCPYYKYCQGGCPAIAWITTDTYLGKDMARCFFYKEGYHKKIPQTLSLWHNGTPIID